MKTITNVHMNYVNDIIIIMGFKNLSDYEHVITYSSLKTSSKKICSKINETMTEFKKIFPQNEFNLRKYNYKFENIDQIIGFVKKLFMYLNIPLDYSRSKKDKILRLIPINSICYKYIMNLRENPQNHAKVLEKDIALKNSDDEKNKVLVNPLSSPWFNSTIEPDTMKNTDATEKFTSIGTNMNTDVIESKSIDMNFSNILKYKKKDFTKTYLTENLLRISSFRNVIEYISWIKISKFAKGTRYRLGIGTKLSLQIGGVEYLNHTIAEDSKFTDNYYTFPVDFPNGTFYKYHEINLRIKSGANYTEDTYKLIISGSTFNSKMPKNIIENNNIIFDHDSKWYKPDEYVITANNGMVYRHHSKLYLQNEAESKNKNLKTMLRLEKENKIKIEQMMIGEEYEKIICLNIMNDVVEKNIENGLTYLADKMIVKKFGNYNTVCINSYEELFPVISELNKNSTIDIYYIMYRQCDFLKYIKILQDVDYDYSCTIKTKGFDTVELDSFNKSTQNKTIMEKYLNLINKHCEEIFLIIQVPESKYDDWTTLNVCFGLCYFDAETDNRKILSKVEKHNDFFY
jgi:hypothetical protein